MRSETICLTSYLREGTGIISNIILKVISERKWGKMNPKSLGGSLSFVGKDDDYPMQRAIALQWEANNNTSFDIPLETFSIEEAYKKDREALLQLLIDLTKKDIPPFQL